MSFYKPNLILFSAQVFLILIAVCTSLVNLSLSSGNQDLWIMVLSSALGYIIPNPKLKIDSKFQENIIKDTAKSQNI